jgi:histidine triad (HIT) family protein
MDSVFTKIINGKIPSYKIAENDKFLAFLDVMPLSLGHTLVVPKQEINYLYDLPDQLLGDLFIFSKAVALKLEKVIDCERIGVTVIGLEVPHAHVHLIPINNVSDMNFAKPKLKVSDKELMDMANLING